VGFLKYLFITAVSWAIGGVYLATTFAMNHTHKPVAPNHSERLSISFIINTCRNWVHRSVDHTTNLNFDYFTTWFTGYLNYQVEHHLFPQLPHPRLPYIQPRVKALFDKHGIAYDLKPMSEAFRITMENLYEVGNWQTQEKYQYLLKQE
jgi:fatty acid desaturase 2 (delta-6 desaturase)